MNENLPVEIDVKSVHALQQAGTPFVFLDCREPAEYKLVHLAGTQLIPMREFPDRAADLEAHRQARIVVHCHHGGRSLRVVQWLRQQGFALAQSMVGGIDAWSVEIDSTLPRYE